MDNTHDLQTTLSNIRREYGQTGLRRGQLPTEPLELFEKWLQDMCSAKVADPTAMTLGTVDENGQPWQRIVLLKGYDATTMTFYTNLTSRKAQQINANRRVSLHFPWHALERQVIATGIAKEVSREQVQTYFSQRPRESQIGAWASRQSSSIASRNELEQRFTAKSQQFTNESVPLPDFWGGFQVSLSHMEFWQGGNHRLHDRFMYQKQPNGWQITRLAP